MPGDRRHRSWQPYTDSERTFVARRVRVWSVAVGVSRRRNSAAGGLRQLRQLLSNFLIASGGCVLIDERSLHC